MSKFVLPMLLLFSLNSCTQVTNKETATQGKMTACAAESHYALIRTEADEFNSLYSQATVSVLSATTREAIVNLLNDSVRIIIVDRKLNQEEQEVVKQDKLALEELKIAQDALAVIVNHYNSKNTISMESLKNILSKKITNWNQLSDSNFKEPIELVVTGRNSGAYELLKSYFFNLSEDLPSSVVTASQQEIVDYVAKHPTALGIISLACYKNPAYQSFFTGTTATVKALALSYIDSTGQQTEHKLHQANVYIGKYPLNYPIYIYFKRTSALAAGFSSFIAGATGQKIILNYGLVPITMPVRIVTITSQEN